VYNYESSDDISNTFHPIKLSGAIRDPNDIKNEVVGDLTTVIFYKTPYIDVEGHPILLCFALGDTVRCNTIIGFPTTNMLEILWNIRQGTVTSFGLQEPNVFAVITKEVEYGVPTLDRNPSVHATRPNPPPPAYNVYQFHCLAKNHQAPFGGDHGCLQHSKYVAFDMPPGPMEACMFKAIPFTGTPSRAPPVLLIDVPSKILRPKPDNTWRIPTYADDIDEDLLVFKEHGVGLTRTTKTRDLPPRDDVEFCDVKYQVELNAGLNIVTSCPEHIRDRVIGVVKKYWDIFFAAGSSRPVRGYEFVIDTGDAKPVCCRLPNYGPH
jgi:hypothetical protein